MNLYISARVPTYTSHLDHNAASISEAPTYVDTRREGGRRRGRSFSRKETPPKAVRRNWIDNFPDSCTRMTLVAAKSPGGIRGIYKKSEYRHCRGIKAFAQGDGATLTDAPSPARALADTIIPLFGIRWNREVFVRVGDLNKLMCRLRNSNLPPDSCWRLGDLFSESVLLTGPPPNRWEE